LIDDPIAAPQPDEMQDEALVGGIVYDLELRALLDRAFIQHAVGDMQ